MGDALFWHRAQFAFTIVYHYLFPQLTMGLALLIVVMKAVALRRDDAAMATAARFWVRVFGINFAVGVVTGIPMEFQFGTNWARFSDYAGGVIGQTLAMEGMFAFFLESTVLGLLVYGEKKLSARGHLLAAVALFLGSWLSGYFIVTTNAFMQHPVGHGVGPDGRLFIRDLGAFLLNPWAPHPVRPHHDGERRHRLLRGVRRRGLLDAPRRAHRGRPHQPPRRTHRGPRCSPAGRLPHRRPPREDGRPPPARRPRRDGGALRKRTDGGDHPHRPAQRRRAPPRQPGEGPGGAVLPRLRDGSPQRPRPAGIPRATSGPATSSSSTTPST
jgi:hypothetical protein